VARLTSKFRAAAYRLGILRPKERISPKLSADADLLLNERDDSAQAGLSGMKGARPNLSDGFLSALTARFDGQTPTPEEIAAYAYATLYCANYRSRYGDLLEIDFPRIPLTSDRELFSALAAKGAEVISLHLMESPKLHDLITSYPQKGTSTVEQVRYEEQPALKGAGFSQPARTPENTLRDDSDANHPAKRRKTASHGAPEGAPFQNAPTARSSGRVWINKTQYFEGVPHQIWEFRIGGYQVCEKWLKDRKGRQLAYDDIQHYQKIVVALKETQRLMAEIDALIPGWPLP